MSAPDVSAWAWGAARASDAKAASVKATAERWRVCTGGLLRRCRRADKSVLAGRLRAAQRLVGALQQLGRALGLDPLGDAAGDGDALVGAVGQRDVDLAQDAERAGGGDVGARALDVGEDHDELVAAV